MTWFQDLLVDEYFQLMVEVAPERSYNYALGDRWYCLLITWRRRLETPTLISLAGHEMQRNAA